MAYTQKQWNDFQADLPVEDRISYLEYLKTADPAEYKRLSSVKTETETKKAELTLTEKQAIVRKLASGAALNDAELEYLNVKPTTTRKPTVTTTRRPVTTKAPVVTTTKAPVTKTTPTPALAVDGGGQYDVGNVAPEPTPSPTPSTSIPNPTSPEATEFYNRLKGKSTSGVPLTAEEKDFNNKYLKHRAAILGGLQFQGKQLTPEQVAEKNFLVGLGYISSLPAAPTPAVATTPIPTVAPVNNEAVLAVDGAGQYDVGEVVATTATPDIVTTAGPDIVTTAGPNVVTTAGPDIVTTAGPDVVTTAAPGVPTYKATDGTVFTDQAAFVAYQKILTDAAAAKNATSAAAAANRQSAYDLLYAQFASYGLGSLVEPLRGLIQSGASPAEFSIKLRESEPYKKRFSANQQRVSKGLKAISEAEYLGLEDQYQEILRNAGLPDTYWKRGDLGVQEGFTNFIANDVSAVELEDRVNTAQQRVLYANPEVSIALKTFYPDISNGDLLAYALDPTKGLEQIKRRITAAEIGSSAVQMGLATNVTDAEYLARYGVDKAQAQKDYRTVAERLPTASKLGDIYSKQGLGAYTQQTAEQDVFNLPGGAAAAEKRRKLSELEQASFSGKAGMGALARDRAGAF
jgi:hypothetical protein